MASGSRVILYLLGIVCALLPRADGNEAPRFVNFPSSIFEKEDIDLETTIGHLEATDSDDTNLELAIRGDIGNSILRLERNGTNRMAIKLKTKLDRETVAEYIIIYQVTDGVNTLRKTSKLYVIDVNDNKPSFTNLPYRVDMPEDSVIGASVFKVSAIDPDSGIWGLVSYNITMQNGMFGIGEFTGDVTLQVPLDYEVQTFFQLEITAMDGDGLNSSTGLIINVIDVQDTPPYFLHLPYTASVPENATVGTSVLQVVAQDGDRGVSNSVNYTLLSGDLTYFHIDSQSGVMTVATPLDREDPQLERLLGVIILTVMTQEVTTMPRGETTATIAVTIHILDINDESPMFNRRVYTAEVLENTQANTPITLLPRGVEMIIADHDQGDNARLEVWLEGCDSFEVVPSRILSDATLVIRVKNSSALDYEARKNFTMQIVAQEYLTAERHSTTAEMIVYIKDMNDNWPRFESDHYTASIPENSARGTFIARITASDDDSGLFSQLTYEILGASSHLFSINATTGDVSVNVAADLDWSLLDRETLDTHQVTVETVDGGGRRSSVRLDVELLDVNDQTPEIAWSRYDTYARENDRELEREVVVQATDRDLPPNNQITYSIVSGDADANFNINSTTGHMTLAGPIDYEAMAPQLAGKFTLVVMATDHGIPPLNSTATVVVNVQDMNDMRPHFESETYSAVISEDYTGGTYVTSVSASDGDVTSPNNEVIYQIETGSGDKFRIDARSGEITVERGADLDRDIYGVRYALVVVARDRGTPQLNGNTTVYIDVTDVNNKSPTFSADRRTVHMPESAAPWREVTTYTATDLDDSSQLRYGLLDDLVEGVRERNGEFVDQGYLVRLFGIHRDNGTVYVKARLDRETVAEVTLTIFVEDVNSELPPQQNATARLTIILDDVNDNSPVFTPSATYVAQISEASQPGLNVKQLLAMDADEHTAPIRYFIVHDTEQSNAFEISDDNRESGVITLKRTVDRERYQWINFTALAVDSGMPALTATANVAVEITDTNDNSPEWQALAVTVDVWENATIGTEVATVWAVDRDSGEFGKVVYFINDGAFGKFQISNTTGIITTLAPLDREDVASYSLTLEARDDPSAPLREQRMTPGYIRVALIDVNDNRPAFDETFHTRTIKENAEIDAEIATVKASDGDAGDNGVVEYSVDRSAGNSSDLFNVQMHVDGGTVYVSASLRGKVGVYSVVVVARDRGDPSLWSVATVVVHVEDVNDYVPTIVRPTENETVYILENVPEGFLVMQVLALDEDTGTNGEVRYELVRYPSNEITWHKFRIDATSGNVTTTGAIDRETQETYYLDVRAYDLGSPSYDDRRTLTVIIVDTDDNPPRFDRSIVASPHQVNVLEERSGVAIATVALATDPDVGNNSHICYYIVGGDRHRWDYFDLDKVSGELRLVRRLDRELTPHVDLVIRASEDCWTDTLQRPENVEWNEQDTTLLWVRVEVKDTNDNAPRFTRRWLTAGVSEDTLLGAPVLNLANYTEDADEGNNSVNYFYIQTPFLVTQPLETQLRQRGVDDVFRIGRQDGIILTNTYFQADMQGRFEFVVMAKDPSKGYQDSANVSIYVLSASQRVRAIVRGSTQEVISFKHMFTDVMSNITDIVINVHSVQTHQDDDGKPDSRKTDMFLHAVDPKTGQVLNSDEFIALIDRHYIHLVHLFKTYNVIEIVRSVPVAEASASKSGLRIALILLVIFLACLVIIVSVTCFLLRIRYKRKLKTATAMVFGSREGGLSRINMPGTNLHAHEGSNPVWLGQYDPTWPQQSDKDSGTSLDNNAVMSPRYDEQEMSLEMYNDELDDYNRVPALTPKTRRLTRNNSTPNLFVRHTPPAVVATSNHNAMPRKLRRKSVGNKVNGNSHSVATNTMPNGCNGVNGSRRNHSGNDNHAYLPTETFKKMDGIEMESTEI